MYKRIESFIASIRQLVKKSLEQFKANTFVGFKFTCFYGNSVKMHVIKILTCILSSYTSILKVCVTARCVINTRTKPGVRVQLVNII